MLLCKHTKQLLTDFFLHALIVLSLALVADASPCPYAAVHLHCFVLPMPRRLHDEWLMSSISNTRNSKQHQSAVNHNKNRRGVKFGDESTKKFQRQ